MSLPAPTPIRHLHAMTSHPGVTGPRPVDVRIGDAERNRVCEALGAHYAAGRLSPDELDVRLGAATTAVTHRDLDELLVDLPRTSAATSTTAPTSGAPQSWSALDAIALVVMVLGCAFVALMLVGSAVISPLVTVFALVGGTAAAITGGLIVHLIHRSRIRAGH